MIWTVLACLAAGASCWWAMRPVGLWRIRARPDVAPGRWGALPWLRQRFRHLDAAARARERAVRQGVPQVCDLLAVCLDAGLPLRAAARIVGGGVDGPAGAALLGVCERIELGLDEVDAWAWLAGEPAFALVSRDISRSVRSGAGLSGRLRAHARDARFDLASARQQGARAAGVSSVLPLVACQLPAFVLLGIVPIFGALVASIR